MAISSNTVWEVRVSGADTNGGGFVTGASGTDYSQQDSAQYALTGLTTAAANAIILTASAASVMVGNIINITGGTNFIAGWYQITSVSVGVSITVDRNCTSAAGVAGIGNIGGALATLNQVRAVAVDENICYGRGVIDVATAVVPWTNGRMEGYSTTRGDGGRMTLRATAAIKIITVSGGNTLFAFSYRNIDFDGDSTGVTGVELGTSNAQNNNDFYNCVFHGFTSHGVSQVYYTNNAFVRCLFQGNGGSGFYNSTFVGGENNFAACVFSSNAGKGFFGESGTGTFAGCLFSGNGEDGCRLSNSSQAALVYNCIFYGNTGDGAFIGRGGAAYDFAQKLVSCIAYGNGGYGVNNPGSSPLFSFNLVFCAMGSNTSGNTTVTAINQIGTVTLTADPFVDAAHSDFNLNNDAGGGALLRAVTFDLPG